MLAISRNPQEIVKIGDEIEVMVIGVQGRRVKLGIKAPAEYRISRAGGKSDVRKSANLPLVTSHLPPIKG